MSKQQGVDIIYRWILDDVMAKMKSEFVQEGVEETILLELRTRWEQKLTSSGLLDADASNAHGQAAARVQNADNPGSSGARGGAQPAAAGKPTAAAETIDRLAKLENKDEDADPWADSVIMKLENPKRRQPDHSPGSSRPAKVASRDGLMQAAYEGSPDALDDFPLPTLPQLDGPGDADEDAATEDGEELKDEDDDLPLSDDDDEEIDNYLCSLFDKVNRTKNRWKCVMKAGVFHIHGRDYLFNKGNGEFQF